MEKDPKPQDAQAQEQSLDQQPQATAPVEPELEKKPKEHSQKKHSYGWFAWAFKKSKILPQLLAEIEQAETNAHQLQSDLEAKIWETEQAAKKTSDEHNQQLSEINAKLTLVVADNESLKVQINNALLQINGLDAKVKEKETEIASLTNDLKKANDESLEQLRQAREDSNKSLRDKESVEHRLRTVNEQLRTAQEQLEHERHRDFDEELDKMKKAHAEAINNSNLAYAQALDKMRKTHRDAIEAKDNEFAEMRNELIAKTMQLTANHEVEIKALKSVHDKTVKDLTDKHNAEIEQLNSDHTNKIAQLNFAHDNKVAGINAQHKQETDALNSAIAKIQAQLDSETANFKQALAQSNARIEKQEIDLAEYFQSYTQLLYAAMDQILEIKDAYKGRKPEGALAKGIEEKIVDNYSYGLEDFDRALREAVDKTKAEPTQLRAAVRGMFLECLHLDSANWMNVLSRFYLYSQVPFIAQSFSALGLDLNIINRAFCTMETLLRYCGITISYPRLFDEDYDAEVYDLQSIRNIDTYIGDLGAHASGNDTVVDLYLLGYDDGEKQRKPIVSKFG